LKKYSSYRERFKNGANWYRNVIFQNVTIASNVKIDNHIVILPNSIVSHDDIIGDYTCITVGFAFPVG